MSRLVRVARYREQRDAAMQCAATCKLQGQSAHVAQWVRVARSLNRGLVWRKLQRGKAQHVGVRNVQVATTSATQRASCKVQQ